MRATLTLVLVGLSIVGCGSATVAELPPAAEPRESPPLSERPAGRIVRVGPPIRLLTADRREPPGGAPEGLAVDERTDTIAVGLRRPPQLALLDGGSGALRRLVDLPAGPRHVAFDGSAGVFAVPAEMADRLLMVDPRRGEIQDVAPTGSFPHAVAASDGVVAVGEERGNTITLFQNGRGLATRRVAIQPGGLTAVDDGRALAVVSVRERVLELYSVPDLTRLARVPAGVGPTHVVARGNVLWVVDTQGDALLIFRRLPELQLVRRVYLPGGPYGIALDPVRERLWITLTATNRIAELPAHGRPHVLRTLPVVRQPNTVAVNSRTGRLFVAGRSEGVVELIDPSAAP